VPPKRTGQARKAKDRSAASIAALILTTDCMIANAPTPKGPAMPGRGMAPEF
jgi:chaperonin GroEL (HSP60 family)